MQERKTEEKQTEEKQTEEKQTEDKQTGTGSGQTAGSAQFVRAAALLLWLCFGLYLFLQYRQVFLCYDDYGYLSLTYGYDARTPENWEPITLLTVLRYTFHSWQEVNGRVFSNFLMALTALCGGLSCFRLVLPCCILGIYLLICRYTGLRPLQDGFPRAAALLATWGLFSTELLRCGAYWLAAAYVYVVPVFFFFLFALYFEKKGRISGIVSVLLAFLLPLASEQAAAMTLTLIAVNGIWDLRKQDSSAFRRLSAPSGEQKHLQTETVRRHRISLRTGLHFAAAAAGTVLNLFSPATLERFLSGNGISYEGMGFAESVIYNGASAFHQFFYQVKSGPSVFLAVCAVLSGLSIWKRERRLSALLLALSGSCFGAASAALLLVQYDLRPYYPLCFLWLLFFFGFSFAEGLRKGNRRLCGLAAVTAASAVPMLLLPGTPVRTFLPFLFLCFALSFLLLREAGVFDEKRLSAAVRAGTAVLCIAAALQMKTVYEGYRLNAPARESNDEKLTALGESYRNGGSAEEVSLYRIPDLLYSSKMPYEDGAENTLYWIDNYYFLPYRCSFLYTSWPDGNDPRQVSLPGTGEN